MTQMGGKALEETCAVRRAATRRVGSGLAGLRLAGTTVVLLLMMLLGDVGLAAGQDTTGDQRPRIQLLRHEEDWRVMQRPENRRDPLDALKYLPVGPEGGSYLRFGGEVRPAVEFYRNEYWGSAEVQRDAYLMQRVMAHGAWIGGPIRIFAQFKSGLLAGRRGPVAPPDRDRLAVHQAFVEWTVGTGRDTPTLVFRAGRQELAYGAGRMVAVREGPNTRQGYDGILGRLLIREWQVEAFYTRVNESASGVFDNEWLIGEPLWGVYARGPGASEETRFDLYYLDSRRDQAVFNGGPGRDQRHTLGFRLASGAGGIRADLEAAYQIGRFRGHAVDASRADFTTTRRIRAWTTDGRLEYRIPGNRWELSATIEAGLTSGDNNPSDRYLQTARPPYPSGQYFGLGTLLGPANLGRVHPYVEIGLRANVLLRAETFLFWRESLRDGLYSMPTYPVRMAPTAESRFVGTMPGGMLRWRISPRLSVLGAVSWFQPGDYLRQSGSAEDMLYTRFQVTYRF